MKKTNIFISAFLTLAIIFAIIPIGAYAASVAILSASDGSNFLASTQQGITTYTAVGSDITLTGITSPTYVQTAIKVRSVSDNTKIKYMRQLKSNSLGSFSFCFSTENYEPGTYEVIVNTEGSTVYKTKYFTIAPPQAPVGAEDVFDCFTVNGRPITFDKSKFAAVNMSASERDYAPVIEISTVDKTARVEMTPSVVPKIPCAVKVEVTYSNNTKVVYSMVLDENSDKRVTDLVKAPKAGSCIIEDNIHLGTDVNNASLVYSDRDNVFWSINSSAIFEGATQIRRAKGDAGGAVNDNTNISGAAKIKNKPYYGGAFSGKNGEPYWLSFVVHADCTVFMSDPHRIGWPNNDGTWKNDSVYKVTHTGGGASASGTSLYYKKFSAGDTVNIPNYGLTDVWPADGVRVYDPPAYAVVWDNNGTIAGADADLKKISYSLDGAAAVEVPEFASDNDTYTITVPQGTKKVAFSVEKSDINAVVSGDLLVELGNARMISKKINVMSAGGIIEKTYTVNIRVNTGNVIYGDVDCDGFVTGDDAMWMLRNELGLPTPQGLDWDVGDVDGDGAVTGDDAMWLLRYELGLKIPDYVQIG